MGVEFLDIGSHGTGNYYTWHLVKGESKGIAGHQGLAAAMIAKMTERAEALGVRILLETSVERLLMDGDRVAGVLAREKKGDEIEVRSRAVVIATGSYGGVFEGIIPGQAGDGIRMAREAGAAVLDRRFGKPPRGSLGAFFALQARGLYSVAFSLIQPGLMVNLLGERFMDEEIFATTPFGTNAISRQKEGVAFNIFDEDTKNRFVKHGFDFGSGFPQVQLARAADFDEEIRKALDVKAEGLYVSESIADLAVQMGIAPGALESTADEYNHACDTGRDDLFDKKPRYLRPVRKPRFYASRIGCRPTEYPGIHVNHRMEVITEEFTSIPGLYAAGTDIGPALYYDTYPNVLPANAMGFCIIDGRLAGEHAAAYAIGSR
jgi:fumarate reductase flavoprotein subunit